MTATFTATRNRGCLSDGTGLALTPRHMRREIINIRAIIIMYIIMWEHRPA